MQLKKFKDVESVNPYITWNKLNSQIKYKLLNNQLKIDLKDIVDQVLLDAGITGFNTKQLLMTIPYSIDDTTTGENVSLIIDNKRFQIRLPEFQVIINKQQKIDWDNTHPHRWLIAQWAKFIEKKYLDTFGVDCVELGIRGPKGWIVKTPVYGKITHLINTIKGIVNEKFDETNVVEYIVWAFDKARNNDKITLNMALLCCNAMVQQWLIDRRRNGKLINKNLSEKWK